MIVALFAGASMMLLAMISVPVSRADDSDDLLNALMMGGSGMPTPSERWLDTTITDYIDPATGHTYTPVLVPTPESFASTSVPTGLADLQTAMADQQKAFPGDPYLVEGYSQSAVISIDEKLQLIASGQHPDVTFLLLGSLNRPDGGLFERFPGLDIPGTGGFPFNGAEPTDAGIPTIDISNQYDFFADFPQFPTNQLADWNAIFGIIYAHAAYSDGPLANLFPPVWPTSEPLTGPFTDQYVLGSTEIVKQVTGDTTFYFIPTTELPLLDPLRSLGVPESVLNIFQPALQVVVEAGYDRSVPFGDPTPAQLIPTIDPVTFSLEFDKALVEGANNAFALFGAQLPGATELENLLTSAETWSAQEIGVPYA
ncbi:MAG: PE-PPE domain-containing protein, partial [Mycobacterium sp.]